MLQLSSLGYSCAMLIAPLVIRIFLVPLYNNQFNRTSSEYSPSADMKYNFMTTSSSFDLMTFTGDDNYDIKFGNHLQQVDVELMENIRLVRLAHAKVIPVYVIVALWFLLMICCDKRASTAAAQSESDSNINKPVESRPLKAVLLAFMVLFNVAATSHEAAISWESAVQDLIISSLLGTSLSIFLSAYIEPIIMLTVAIALLLFGTIQLLISQYIATTNTFVISSSLFILGLGYSALIAINLFLISKYVTMMPAIFSLYLISLSVGRTLASDCYSRIYESQGQILFVLAVLVLLFFAMEVFVGKLISKDQQKKRAHITSNNYDMNEEGRSLNA